MTDAIHHPDTVKRAKFGSVGARQRMQNDEEEARIAAEKKAADSDR